MTFPDKEGTSKPIRVKKGLNDAIEAFLKTDKAADFGFETKADVANAAVRDLLLKVGYLKYIQPDHDEEKAG